MVYAYHVVDEGGDGFELTAGAQAIDAVELPHELLA